MARSPASGLTAGSWPTPIRSVVAPACDGVGTELPHRAVAISRTPNAGKTNLMRLPAFEFCLGSVIYLLFNRPSSTNAEQNPVGFAVVAFLITVIFILIS